MNNCFNEFLKMSPGIYCFITFNFKKSGFDVAEGKRGIYPWAICLLTSMGERYLTHESMNSPSLLSKLGHGLCYPKLMLRVDSLHFGFGRWEPSVMFKLEIEII